MINLAPFRYSQVLTTQQGPIERIEYGRVKIAGHALYHANAYLSGTLHLQKAPLQIYNNADGSGTHRSPILARYLAISEAIERWALYFLNQTNHLKPYGFDVDHSSCGMSAFPGLFKGQARKRAMSEAAERFCLVSWWHGDLPAKRIQVPNYDCEGIEIRNPASRDRVVLLWKELKSGFFVYGFSGSRKFKDACWKADIEMERTSRALQKFFTENPGFEKDDLSVIENHQERRVVYYSLPEGHREFLNRVDGPQPGTERKKVLPVIDCEVPGPWGKYATVWRVIYPMPTREYLNPKSNFFFW
jgi:hypothetical protein